MKSLIEKKWLAFDICKIFSIDAGIRLTKSNMKEGNCPFIGATDSNNGITEFVSNTNSSIDQNVLGVNYNGSVVENFYHPYKAIFSDDVKRLHLLNFNDNKYVLLFMKSAILKQQIKYQYGYKFNSERMRKQKIMLPVDENDCPDYAYMEAYMKAVEKRLLTQYRAYLTDVHESGLAGGGKIEKVPWKAFFLDEICTINSGRDIYERERVSGDTPYLTATAEQNGIGYFVGNSNETIEDGCISVNRNGSVGYAFYHPYPALYGNDTRKLIPFNKNKYVAMFLAKMITAQKDKYSYGLKMGTGRLRRQKIMLPVDKNSNPDYTYMENYMKALEYQLKTRYIDYLLQANTNNP